MDLFHAGSVSGSPIWKGPLSVRGGDDSSR